MTDNKYTDLLQPYEEIWMEKNIISSYVNDQGGSIKNILFKIEPTEDGFLFVLELTVSGIDSLTEETENLILDKVEALTDDMDDEFDQYGLSLEDLEDFRIDLIKE